MADSEYDPAADIARKLTSMDGPTRDRTLRMWQEMMSKNQTVKQQTGYAACDTASPSVSTLSRELRLRRERLQYRMRQAQEDILRLNDLIRLLEGD